MYAYDFEYDGKLLSDFGFIVCSFGDSGGVEATEKGSEVEFTLAPVHAGRRQISVGAQYENCLSTKFQVCKNPERYRDDQMEITPEEFRAMSRWLNRREFLWFRNFDWCEPEKVYPWFRASFQLTKIEIDNATYGIELDMETDSPFGFGNEEVISLDLSTANSSVRFADQNDEIGETYPEVTITCRGAGTLTLSCDITGCECEIKNCSNGEIIHMSGETMIIESSVAAHDIANDFNYDFFHFGNTYAERENIISVGSVPCTVELRYRPTMKDTL